VDCIHLTEDRIQWWVLMNALTTFKFHKRRRISRSDKRLSASQGLCLIASVPYRKHVKMKKSKFCECIDGCGIQFPPLTWGNSCKRMQYFHAYPSTTVARYFGLKGKFKLTRACLHSSRL
jgi:hypothetical protein